MGPLEKLNENVKLDSCSLSVRKGIKWLENELKFDEKKILLKIKEVKRIKDKKARERRTEALKWRLEQKYSPYDSEEFYILNRVNRPLVKEYLKYSKTEDFWGEELSDIAREPLTLYYLSKLGLKDNKYFQECYKLLVGDQRVSGRLGEWDQAHHLRTLIEIDKNSQYLNKAEEYYLKEEFWMDSIFYGVNFFDAILGLFEFDYYSTVKNFKENIDKALDFRIYQAKETFRKIGFTDMRLMSYVLQTLTKVYGIYDKRVVEIIGMIKKQQNEDGSWGIDKESKLLTTSDALLGLIETGEGPKIPIQSFEFEFNKLIREYELSKPKFLHTSPVYGDKLFIKEIEPTFLRFIFFTEKILRISSPYLELYNDALIKKSKKDKIELRILTRSPPSHSRKIINDLNRKTKGAVRFENRLHSRMIIRDDVEMFVSSADLNLDSFTNQFNAGIWTIDIDAVKEGIEYFDNIWEKASIK